MTKPTVFLSYSQQDSKKARTLEDSLKDKGLQVWRDEQSIGAGELWSKAIERGIRGSLGAVVLITPFSASSEWVTYEYAFATGAGIPVVAVKTQGAPIPTPIQQFQLIDYTDPSVAKKIVDGLSIQSRALGEWRASTPTLVAKFKEINGEPVTASRGETPELSIEMWLEQVPKQTTSVAFEIFDMAFEDRNWTARRAPRGASVNRAFLCDDMRSYGDIEIWASGIGRGPGNWSGSWRLYEALMGYYRSRSPSAGVRAALKQIRTN